MNRATLKEILHIAQYKPGIKITHPNLLSHPYATIAPYQNSLALLMQEEPIYSPIHNIGKHLEETTGWKPLTIIDEDLWETACFLEHYKGIFEPV